jgi:HAD superfamily hydrolase (TIGR01509 family)
LCLQRNKYPLSRSRIAPRGAPSRVKIMAAPDPIIIFDLGGVLVRHDNEVLFDRLAACCADPSSARPHLSTCLGDKGIGTGTVGVDALHARLTAELGFKESLSHFLELWSSHFSEEPGMEGVVKDLAKRHRTILFSNTNAPHIDHIRANYPVFGHVHATYLSYEIGLVKPDIAAYQRVLDLEGCLARDCIFIDDRAENTAAAESLGIRTLTYTGRDAFIAGMARLGVAVKA